MATIEILSFDEIKKYQKIPFFKDSEYRYQFMDQRTYTSEKIPRVYYDLNDEDDIDTWKDILNFDHSCILVAKENDKYLAGAVVATHSPKVNLLKGFKDTAILWDIRVDPKFQGRRIGSLLMEEVIKFSKSKGCKKLLIETQDNNAKAIDFYLKCGAYLHLVREHVYEDYPLEKQYLFLIDL